VTAADAAGTATTGATNGAIGMGVTAFRTKGVLTAAGARGRTILPRLGAAPLNHGVGVTHTKRFARTTFGRRRSRTPDPPASGQAREDFAVILDELAFLREPLARLPDPRRVRWIVLRAALGALAAIGAVAPVLVW